MHKFFWSCSLVVFFSFVATAKMDQRKSNDPDPKQLYQSYCALCHGADGKLGLNSATDLTTSELSLEERIKIIETGKGMMMAYQSMLTKEQIKLVGEYTLTLKN